MPIRLAKLSLLSTCVSAPSSSSPWASLAQHWATWSSTFPTKLVCSLQHPRVIDLTYDDNSTAKFPSQLLTSFVHCSTNLIKQDKTRDRDLDFPSTPANAKSFMVVAEKTQVGPLPLIRRSQWYGFPWEIPILHGSACWGDPDLGPTLINPGTCLSTKAREYRCLTYCHTAKPFVQCPGERERYIT